MRNTLLPSNSIVGIDELFLLIGLLLRLSLHAKTRFGLQTFIHPLLLLLIHDCHTLYKQALGFSSLVHSKEVFIQLLKILSYVALIVIRVV